MSAEDIAKVVRDVRTGRYVHPSRTPGDKFMTTLTALLDDDMHVPVVDVTAVYKQWQATEDGKFIYEDHVGAPPWNNALLCYENPWGNIIVIHLTSSEINNMDPPSNFPRWQPGDKTVVDEGNHRYIRQDGLSTSDPYHTIDWDEVKWGVTALVFSGGKHSSGVPVPTAGPLHMWRIPVYPDGTLADVQWTQMHPEMGTEVFDTAMMVLLETLTLCNCVNVVVAEPTRHVPRPEQRRLQRLGVRFSEIHIRPVSKSYRGIGTALADMRPIHGVRGHYAKYGPEYNKGLLFGKYSGKFWVPPHVRGSKEAGTVMQEYVAEP